MEAGSKQHDKGSRRKNEGKITLEMFKKLMLGDQLIRMSIN